MCEVMDPEDVDTDIVNQILNSIVTGMQKDSSDRIRLAAVIALNNSLIFTSQNFENPNERNAIMQAICEATQSKVIAIREKAFECASTVATNYYDKLQAYVEALFQLTINAIRTDEARVGMQAIEFWNAVCDEELNVVDDIENEIAKPEGYFRLIEHASPLLTPLLLECMTKQEENNDDDDAWDIAMAAATLLEAIARLVGDNIVELVLPFVTQNISNTSWRLKEAAIMAFGMILDGPSSTKISPLVTQATPILIGCLRDPKPLVRDTSAWTIGKICELHSNALVSELIPPMVEGLSAAMDDINHKVIHNACFAVHNLAQACEESRDQPTNILSHFMPLLLQKLLHITTRGDVDSDNVRSQAFEAINMMVANSAKDMNQIVLQLLTEALNRLEHSFAIATQDRMNVQSSLCSLIGEAVKKLTEEEVGQYADRIMQLVIQVLGTKGSIALEDGFLVVGFLTEKLGKNIARYLVYLLPHLMAGLKNIEEYQVCTCAVGVVGDLCRALGRNILTHCDDIMKCLLELLHSEVLHRSVKPHVISLFADIALAIEGDFERYTQIVLGILKQAGELNITGDDEDLIEYINTLRNSILEAYTGILQVNSA